MSKPFYVGIDFDGTVVMHEYPEIGAPVPGAFTWLSRFQEGGAKLILWTMRSDAGPVGQNKLTEAEAFCLDNGIEFYGVNKNPTQRTWTKSPKAYCHLYIDDAAFGCPLVIPEVGRPYVDWSVVGPAVMQLIEANQ